MNTVLFLASIFVWAIGGWITGLILKGTGLRMKGGYIFLMLIGWFIAGVAGMVCYLALTNGGYSYSAFSMLFYGLAAGAIGGFVTVRQIAKARKVGK